MIARGRRSAGGAVHPRVSGGLVVRCCVVADGFDFDGLTEMWVARAEQALERVPLPDGETLSAVAFWLFYAEQGGRIMRPALSAIGTHWLADAGGDAEERGFGSIHWNPADWPWYIEPSAAEEIDRVYEALTAAACVHMRPGAEPGADPEGEAAWERVFARSVDAVIDAARALTERARRGAGLLARLPLDPSFVVVVCDPSQGQEGELWLARSLDEPLRSTLCPGLPEPV